MSTALVSLVGAGPGDPELLTLKAVRRLAEADLVLYDALVSTETLAFASRGASMFRRQARRRAGDPQEEINRRMIRAAQSGQRVVRLKCGDPFVFGRGGEEALALAAAGILCEVVPESPPPWRRRSWPAFPVTHRGLASAFVVVSGHAASAFEPVLRSLEPGSATIVVMMGLANRAEIARALMTAGWSRSTPAAIVVRRIASRRTRVARDAGRTSAAATGTSPDTRRERRDQRGRRRSRDATTSPRPSTITKFGRRPHVCPRRSPHRSGARGFRLLNLPRSTSSSRRSGAFERGEIDAEAVARVPARARHVRPASGRRCADAAGEDPPGHDSTRRSCMRWRTSPSNIPAASGTSRRDRTCSSTSCAARGRARRCGVSPRRA